MEEFNPRLGWNPYQARKQCTIINEPSSILWKNLTSINEETEYQQVYKKQDTNGIFSICIMNYNKKNQIIILYFKKVSTGIIIYFKQFGF